MKRTTKTAGFISLLAFLCLAFACSADYSPKPSGYPRIDLEAPQYQRYEMPRFDFLISDKAHVKLLPDTLDGYRFNIVYPSLKAALYCAYFEAQQTGQLSEMDEDTRKFVAFHLQRADAMQQRSFEDRERQLYAELYKLEGSAASPLQFTLTDSCCSYLRAALYFDEAVKPDSIAPVVEYLDKDIQTIIESFRWKRQDSR